MTKFSATSKVKLNILSEKMATPIKSTSKGKDTRASPEYTALTGKRPDGTSVPTKIRTTPLGTNKNKPKKTAEGLDTPTCDSMNDTILALEKGILYRGMYRLPLGFQLM